MGRNVRHPYSPEQIAKMTKPLVKAVERISRQEEVMRRAQVESVLIGDAMIRRSYHRILRFAAALERAIEKSSGRQSPAPWDEVDHFSDPNG